MLLPKTYMQYNHSRTRNVLILVFFFLFIFDENDIFIILWVVINDTCVHVCGVPQSFFAFHNECDSPSSKDKHRRVSWKVRTQSTHWSIPSYLSGSGMDISIRFVCKSSDHTSTSITCVNVNGTVPVHITCHVLYDWKIEKLEGIWYLSVIFPI